MIPLGIRNNNPLNIRRGKTLWKGETPQATLDGRRESHPLPPRGEAGRGAAFCQFSFIEWGLRAAFCLLRTYRDKYKANCIRDIISRWAPPSENDTERYIQNVCLWTGFGGLQRLTEKDWPKLVRAMARQECGTLLDEETINKGYKLYKNIKDETRNKEQVVGGN